VVKDRDFTKLEKKLPTTRGPANQVEVVYFFWYGSDLSWKIDRQLRQWAVTQPYPVRLAPSPAILGDSPYQVLGARIFFTLVELQREPDLGPLFFDAVQTKQVDMTNPQDLVDWFETHGVKRKQFLDTINSNRVKASTLGVYRTMRDYKVQSVPTIVLDGEYNIRATLKTSPERVAAVAEFMAEKLSHGGARP
jgi:thiol:disulfide interchange protein DsbA